MSQWIRVFVRASDIPKSVSSIPGKGRGEINRR